MKSHSWFSLLLACQLMALPAAFAGPLAPAAPSPTPAMTTEDDLLGFTVGLTYDTPYFFRGVEYGNNGLCLEVIGAVPVSDSLNVDFYSNFGALVGDDTVLGDASARRMILGTGLSTKFGETEASLRYRYYTYDGEMGDNFMHDGQEVGGTLGRIVGPVHVALSGFYDFETEGWYFEGKVSSAIPVTERISLVPSVSVGYGIDYDWHFQGKFADDGFTAVELGLCVPFALTSRATFMPFIAGVLPIDALDDVGFDAKVHGGAMITVKF